MVFAIVVKFSRRCARCFMPQVVLEFLILRSDNGVAVLVVRIEELDLVLETLCSLFAFCQLSPEQFDKDLESAV
jgi:hypothetical protein